MILSDYIGIIRSKELKSEYIKVIICAKKAQKVLGYIYLVPEWTSQTDHETQAE